VIDSILRDFAGVEIVGFSDGWLTGSFAKRGQGGQWVGVL